MIVLYIVSAVIGLFLVLVLFLAICALFVDTKMKYEQKSRFYRFLLYGSTAVALKILRIKVHVTGLEKLPEDSMPLFVGNHRSNFDPIIEWQILKKYQPAFISKAENFKIPIFGKIIHRCCFMAIDREDPRKALQTINQAASLLSRGEMSVAVYPEGTRSKSGVLLPFHNGVFKIARKAGSPIAVLAIRGTEKIHKQVILHRSDIYLDVACVIPAEEVKSKKTAEIGEEVRAALMSRLSENGG